MEERIRHADRLAAVGRFAAGLAHEIRNPLGSIRGSEEVLRQSLAPRGDDRRLMDIVLRESDRLDGIISEFLEFSGPQTLVRIDTDIVGMLDEILLLLSHQCPSTVRVVRDYGEPTIKAWVDAGQMRQALWNLCRNALEAMPQGGELRVRAHVEVRPGGADGVEIVVEDTGVGVPPEQVPRLFEPFYTTKPSGTGLGLAIVHRIVEDHGGEIRVESEPGVGTRFTITIPVEAR
jgi:two-component system sensor histidine kinase PilS (NtrC family)